MTRRKKVNLYCMIFSLRTIVKLSIVCLLAVLSSELIYGYTGKCAPVMTKWVKDVEINTPHPEYPRPQIVRDEALQALRPGEENEMAVYCRDTAGERFFDVGISLRAPM